MDFRTRILDSRCAILIPSCRLYLGLLTFEKGQITEERPKVPQDFRLQSRCAEDLWQLAIDIVVGFLELVEEGSEQFAIPANRLAKVNDMQLPAGFEHAVHLACCLPLIGRFQVMDHDA